MAKTVTRTDVLRFAAEHHWVVRTEALDASVGLVPIRDRFEREDLRLTVSWTGTPFSAEARFAFALLEGAGLPVAVPNIHGTYREKGGVGACVMAVLDGRWRP